MKTSSLLRNFVPARLIVAVAAAFAVVFSLPQALGKGGTGGGTGAVGYNIPTQIVQGDMPLSFTYTLQVTSPATITGPTSVSLNLILLSAASGATPAQALSFVSVSQGAGAPLGTSYTPNQPTLTGNTLNNIGTLSFTGPNQTIPLQLTTFVPVGNWAGSFGYELQTTGWDPTLNIIDQGAFINVTATQSAPPAQPLIQITNPLDQTVYTWVAGNGSLTIPYTFVGWTPDGSPLLTMNGSVNNTNLGVSPIGLGTANATASGAFSVNGPGVYNVSATDTNANGSATTSISVTVVAQGAPPSVVINSPAPNSTYVLTGSSLNIPYTFTGSSIYGGITQLTATLDGNPVAFTSEPYGALSCNATGTLPITSIGIHRLLVTASNAYGTATTSESVSVTAGKAINLGSADSFTILTYNSSNNSDSAFQCGSIGVVKGNWAQSGGQRTNTQQATTVFLSPSYKNSGPTVESTVVNSVFLNSAWADATSLASSLAAQPATQSLGAITKNTTITETAVGNYVFNVTNISLNHPANLTISAPAGSTVVLNISGSIVLNGGTDGGRILITGGLTNDDVVYNLTGTGSVVHTAGGGNGAVIQGLILAPNGTVQIDPGEVDGEIIAQTFSCSSGTLVAPCQ